MQNVQHQYQFTKTQAHNFSVDVNITPCPSNSMKRSITLSRKFRLKRHPDFQSKGIFFSKPM